VTTGEKCEKLLRILIDSGSQRSFILKEASKYLQCTSIGRENLDVFPFMRKEPISIVENIVRVKLSNSELPNSFIDISAVECESLCRSMPDKVPTRVLELAQALDLKLADQYFFTFWLM
jgi:hypothetical protein